MCAHPLNCKYRRYLLSQLAHSPAATSKVTGSTDFIHQAPGQAFAAPALWLSLPTLQSPLLSAALGKDLGYALQFTATGAAFWAACCKLQMMWERAGQAMSGTFTVEKSLNSAWDSDRARGVWAERRWMEPCKSSARFPGASSASVTEGLPEQARWGQNFHVILGHAQDRHSVRTEEAENDLHLAIPTLQGGTYLLQQFPELQFPCASVQQSVQRTRHRIQTFEILLWIKLFQVMEWGKFQPFSAVCRKRQTQARQATPRASPEAVGWKARWWLSFHL